MTLAELYKFSPISAEGHLNFFFEKNEIIFSRKKILNELKRPFYSMKSSSTDITTKSRTYSLWHRLNVFSLVCVKIFENNSTKT